MRKFVFLLALLTLATFLIAEEDVVIGVLMSDYTARWYAELGFKEPHWGYLEEMKRIFDFVRDLGYKVVPIFDRDLELYADPNADPVVKFTRTYDISKLKLLILPDNRRMSPLEIAAVKKFVKNGGKIFALAQTSFRDHNNKKWPNNEYTFALYDILKISYNSFAWKPPQHGYIKKTVDHPIWEGLGEFVPTPRHWVMIIKVLEGGKVLGEWYNDDKEMPSHMPDLNAAIVETEYGIYIGEDLFINPNFEQPEVQMLLANIIDYLVGE